MTTDTELLIVDDEIQIVIEVDTEVELVELGEQGPRGIQGIPGPAGGTTVVTVGATPLSGHTAVAMDADGLLIYAGLNPFEFRAGLELEQAVALREMGVLIPLNSGLVWSRRDSVPAAFPVLIPLNSGLV